MNIKFIEWRRRLHCRELVVIHSSIYCRLIRTKRRILVTQYMPCTSTADNWRISFEGDTIGYRRAMSDRKLITMIYLLVYYALMQSFICVMLRRIFFPVTSDMVVDAIVKL